MLDKIPTNVANGIRISVINLPKIFKKNEEEPTEEQDNNVSKHQTTKKNPIPTMLVLGLAELVGTALLLFLGCMGCITAIDMVPIPHHIPALSFGLVVMLIIQLFGHISGAHLNPAVTIATVILGILKPVMLPVYIVGQFIGSLAGFGLLKVLIPPEYTATEIWNPHTNRTEHRLGLCSTVLHPRVSLMQAVAMETIVTSILILVCCAVWDKRNAHNSDSAPLRFGLIITAIGMVAGPYTGASMNTPRSFAPALFNNDWDAHWVYWVGPTLGAVVGTVFYKTFFQAPKDDDEDDLNMESMPLKEKHPDKQNNV